MDEGLYPKPLLDTWSWTERFLKGHQPNFTFCFPSRHSSLHFIIVQTSLKDYNGMEVATWRV